MHPLIQIEGREFWGESAWSILIVLLSIMMFKTLSVQMKRLTCSGRFIRGYSSWLLSPDNVLAALCNHIFICSNYSFQIAVDCPRTVPDVSFFQQPEVQKSLERILYIWLVTFYADRHMIVILLNWLNWSMSYTVVEQEIIASFCLS